MGKVDLREITKSYGTTSVLKNVSLSIADGEFLTLLGPSGCGKSTLLRILAGLELQSEGTVTIDGRNVDGTRPKGRDIAMVFQSYALYPHMTVAANMSLPLRMRRLNAWQRLPLLGERLPGARRAAADIARDVKTTSEALNIDHLLDRKPGQLSGGQRQRVAVGRAMVRQPAVFLMDEPLSNLDAKLRVQMRIEIKELHHRLGVTFVYVTHDQTEAMTLSDRVAVMLDGQLLQVAPPQEIYANPDDRRVAEFIGSPKINMLSGSVREPNRIDVAGAALVTFADLEPGTSVSVGIRPEALHLAQHTNASVFTGTVRLIEHMGSDLFVHLDLPGQNEALIARLLAERAPQITVGQTLHLAADPQRLLLFDTDGRRIRSGRETKGASLTQLRGIASW